VQEAQARDREGSVPARSGATGPQARVGRRARHHLPYHRRVHVLGPL